MKFKYIDRYWKKGRWNYVYPKDMTDKNSNRPFVRQNKLSINNRYTNKATTATSKRSEVKNMVDDILKKMGGTSLSKASKTVEKGKSFVFKKVDKLYNMRKKDLQNKRESGYAADAKAKTEAAQKKLAETRANKRESGYAADAKAKTEAAQKKLAETKSKVESKKWDEERKDELAEYDRSKFHRGMAIREFGLSNLNVIDRNNVGTTKDETAKINPDYDPKNPETSQNCGFCSVAWILRKKGFDVEAKHDMVGDWNDTEDDSFGVYDYQLEQMFVDPLKDAKIEPSGPLDWLGIGKKKLNTMYNKTFKIEDSENFKNLVLNLAAPAYTNIGGVLFEEYGGRSQEKLEKYAEEIILKKSKNNNYGMLSVGWKYGGGHALNYQVENGKVMVYDGQVNKSYPLSELVAKVDSMAFMDCTSLVPTENVNHVVQNRRKR